MSDKQVNDKQQERREFLQHTLKAIGVVGLGGFLWGGYVHEAKSAPLILRPPGAENEDKFLSLCIKCGQCVEACYNRKTRPESANVTLKLAKPGDQKPMGTPYFIPRETPCYMCTDIPCTASCPTQALNPSLVKNIELEWDINKAQMGIAIVDMRSCIAYWGIQCDACYRACPLIDKAIELDYARNTRTGKHAFLTPIVNPDYCTGCGMCEHACVTKKASIMVLPRDVALGGVGINYIKGWDKKDELRLKELKTQKLRTKTKRSEDKPKDYLNKGDLLDE